MNPWQWAKLGILVMQMFFKYGPTVVRWGVRIYHKVEDFARGHLLRDLEPPVRSEVKRQLFDDMVKDERDVWIQEMGADPTPEEIAIFRERIHRRLNPVRRNTGGI